MKNLKVSMKLIVSFVIVIALAVVVGVVGIIGMLQMNAADDDMYNMNLVAIEQMGIMQASLNEQRSRVRDLVIYNADHNTFITSEARLETEDKTFRDALALYEPTMTDPVDIENTNIIKTNYERFRTLVAELIEYGEQNLSEEAQAVMDNEMLPVAQTMMTALTANNELNKVAAKAAVDGNTSLFMTMTIVEIIVLAIAIAVAFILAFYISGLISKPLKDMMGYIKQAGETGNLKFRDDEWANCDRLSLIKDEIGQTMKAFTAMMRKFVYYGEAVGRVSEQDLTVEVATLGDSDTFGNAIRQMVDNLNEMFGEINNSTAQVSTGSKQIADGSQALAQGSTQQAAAVEQLSSSITEIAQKTKDNADMASKAANLAGTIKTNAEKGSRQMDEMMTAVKDINVASQSINKVIKVIDDIAFQTNILALNAAVEAARAGQHGKGFAVVAEEVRSLAAKSAEAAKDTGGLIANSMEKAELGARIADDTAASLVEIVSGINESSQIVTEIAKSSEEQSLGIAQINRGIDQVAQVVQQNSATAEESAAASEEMSGQANMLEELIFQFKLKNTAQRRISSDGGFGRY
ncbi:MAG: methyl-accepting chemotaxis protein [Oscillospiraceae bacterium]|jgi:methyl-accepting chemotaxis protein|nr:methyl-accepting chemotaxis protein [Oscillospiraceae bacterium]